MQTVLMLHILHIMRIVLFFVESMHYDARTLYTAHIINIMQIVHIMRIMHIL